MKEHKFYDTSEAYDNTQCNDEIKVGDIIIIEREQVVGISDTWPIAVTIKHGQLHTPKKDISLDELVKSMNDSSFKDVDYKKSFKLAVKKSKRTWISN